MKNNKHKFMTFVVLLNLLLVLVGCGNEKSRDGEIKISFSSTSEKGNQVEDTIQMLKDQGFSQVDKEPIPDLITGWLTKDGEVEEVLINDNNSYKDDSWIKTDAKIIVRYHTFPEKEVAKNPETPPEKKDESKKAEETKSSENQVEETDEIITAENSEDFKAVLNSNNPGDQIVVDFISNNTGRMIQFDAYSWDWTNHSTISPISGKEKVYNTLYTTNFYVGNIETFEENLMGPTFRAEGVRILNYTSALDRANLTVTARIKGYKATHEFFLLENVTFEGR